VERKDKANFMKIYTKRGDQGKTDLFSGERVLKTNPLIEAYGTVDELNAILGIVLSFLDGAAENVTKDLIGIQDRLHVICANLANTEASDKRPEIQESHIDSLEERCDYYQDQIPVIRHFIHPGGVTGASHLHHARTVCRRAERRVIAAMDEYEIAPLTLKYLNRLSDLLFLMARYLNNINNEPERKVNYE